MALFGLGIFGFAANKFRQRRRKRAATPAA
jgi:hypothetical protein